MLRKTVIALLAVVSIGLSPTGASARGGFGGHGFGGGGWHGGGWRGPGFGPVAGGLIAGAVIGGLASSAYAWAPAMDTMVRIRQVTIVAALNRGTGSTITVAPTRCPGMVRLLTTVPGRMRTS